MKNLQYLTQPFLHPSFYRTDIEPKEESAWAISDDMNESPKQGEWIPSHKDKPYQNIGRSLTEFKVTPAKALTTVFEIEVGGRSIGELPIQLYEIKKSIDDAKYMLDLEEDWDDEGGMPVDKNTFIRAIKFLINYSVWLLRNQSIFLVPPQIHPGPDGSIDILWRTKNYRMLINVLPNPERQFEYYGDDKKDGNSIKGKVPSNGVQEFLALWLKNLKV